ncbi:hypothetical protein BCR34DRAFT_602625 [Clohesyomyces aquaticus]|uniref:Uncharacterized protein n=1 Tax=Clohesyomyces aquaticus TaxID=1231657 RepID=A0A1Y1ZHV0_9PLEO|nr:hypothetical protein BCR34DRAFT_602625 [Clohesyomyces aquaticus]
MSGIIMGSIDSDETLLGLCASYAILASVEDCLNLMEQRQFCTNFFSLLVERDSHEGIAEIVNMPKSAVIELVEALLGPAIDKLLSLMSCLPPEPDELEEDSHIWTQRLARSVALLLDLGVDSYFGSHGSRFDVKYFKREMDFIRYFPKNVLGFECSMRPLACLDCFLDKKSVWVFQIGVDLAPWSLLSSEKREKLSILTTIDTFAHIRGPVWAELVEQDSSENPIKRIKKYHFSKGCIRPMAKSFVTSEVKGHWFSWPEEYRLRFSRYFTPQFEREPEVFLRLDDKLLIGAELLVN